MDQDNRNVSVYRSSWCLASFDNDTVRQMLRLFAWNASTLSVDHRRLHIRKPRRRWWCRITWGECTVEWSNDWNERWRSQVNQVKSNRIPPVYTCGGFLFNQRSSQGETASLNSAMLCLPLFGFTERVACQTERVCSTCRHSYFILSILQWLGRI